MVELVPQSFSSSVSSSLPSFYFNDGPSLVAFIGHYYKWLATYADRQVAANRDIDSAPSEFIEKFRTTYLPHIDITNTLNKQLVIKHATDLYRAKGTPRAIDLLFKIVFQCGAIVNYPSSFRLSDNTWEPYLYVELSHVPTNKDLIGKIAYNNTRLASAYFETVETERTSQEAIVDIARISNVSGTFHPGDLLTNQAVIKGSFGSYSIQNSNNNIPVNSQITITSVNGSGAVGVVQSTNQNGQITSIVITNSGIGYLEGEQGIITSNQQQIGTLTCHLQAIGVRPGQQTQRSGILSSNNGLYDGEYFQDYSYEIESPLSIDKYIDMVTNVVHIAGTKPFGKTVIVAEPSLGIKSYNEFVVQ